MNEQIISKIGKELHSLVNSEEECYKFLADQKWANGFVCRTCGNTNFCRGKSLYSRRCTRCKHEESVTAHTIFHRCHIPITDAFRIVHMVCSDQSVSTYEISRQIELRQMTCWNPDPFLLHQDLSKDRSFTRGHPDKIGAGSESGQIKFFFIYSHNKVKPFFKDLPSLRCK